MSLTAWFRHHVIASPQRWATVMARADEYEAAHSHDAASVLEEECIKLSDPDEYDLLQDVLGELRRREEKRAGP